ncbi:MAG: hypothetical protein ACRDFQ_06750 [Anaerolineales bacterium]
MDEEAQLETILAFLDEHGVRYCVVGGQAVNAYVEPLVSLDLDLAVAAEHLEEIEGLLARKYRTERYPHSINIVLPGSDLRVQIQTDKRYSEFVDQAEKRDVLGIAIPVANLEDVLRGKVWAAQDEERRGSKRQKDLADISRILEAYPEMRSQVPAEVLANLL